jgi:LysR family nitrogen assimilation transcriptional regulator
MDTKALTIFIKLSELGSLTRASLALELTPSTISRQLAQLETQCGGKLFFRNGRGVILTPLGECVLPHAQAILAGVERLQRDSVGMAGVPTGVVRIGMMPALAPILVPQLYAHVAERYPRVTLSLSEGYSSELDEMLADGSIDLAIIFQYGRSTRAGRDFLAPVDSWLVAGPGVLQAHEAPIPFENIARQPLALPPLPNNLRVTLARQAAQQGIDLNVVIEISSFITLLELLEQGHCLSVLPYFAVSKKLASGQLSGVPIAEPSIARSLMLATTSFVPASLAVREVSRIMRTLIMGEAGKMLLSPSAK